jgi:hypothetical protein
LGFAVKKNSGHGQFNHGYLTVGGCSIKKEIPRSRGFGVFVRGFDHNGREINFVVGGIYMSNFLYLPEQGINIVSIKIAEDR